MGSAESAWSLGAQHKAEHRAEGWALKVPWADYQGNGRSTRRRAKHEAEHATQHKARSTGRST
eukprot:4653589-Alexandrium_andersonii.AAC.1